MTDLTGVMRSHLKGIVVVGMLSFALSGCASQILKGFVGRDVGTVIARYGPYENAFDMPDGRRAFQWRLVEESLVPTETVAEDVETHRSTRQNVRTTGGYWKEEVCFYTVYAVPSGRDGWLIVDYEKPSFDCE
ncbi:MAG: hypothetical protein AAGL10_10170 [Pseudomonadota bacterium]